MQSSLARDPNRLKHKRLGFRTRNRGVIVVGGGHYREKCMLLITRNGNGTGLWNHHLSFVCSQPWENDRLRVVRVCIVSDVSIVADEV